MLGKPSQRKVSVRFENVSMRCVNRNLSLCRKAQLPTAVTTDAWLRQPKIGIR